MQYSNKKNHTQKLCKITIHYYFYLVVLIFRLILFYLLFINYWMYKKLSIKVLLSSYIYLLIIEYITIFIENTIMKTNSFLSAS